MEVGKKYFYNGEWLTLAELGYKYKKSYSCLRYRLDSGYSLEEALTKPLTYRGKNTGKKEVPPANPRKFKTLTLNGVTKTYAEWALEKNVTVQLITTRLKLGWTVEEALNTPVSKKKLVDFNYKPQRVIRLNHRKAT